MKILDKNTLIQLAKENRLEVSHRLEGLNKTELTSMLLKIYDILDWTCADGTPEGEFSALQLEKIGLEFEAATAEESTKHYVN